MTHLLRLIALVLILPAMSFSGAASANAATPPSPLSHGKWIKMRIDSTGIYRLSHGLLREWGIDNPGQIAIAGFGSVECAPSTGPLPDFPRIVPVYRTPDAIYFYGEGSTRIIPASATSFTEHRNLYTSVSHYYISCTSGIISPDIESVSAEEITSDPETHHIDIDFKRLEEVNPLNQSLFSYSHDLTRTGPREIDFILSEDTAQAFFLYRYIGSHGESGAKNMQVSFSNGINASPINSKGISNTNTSNLVYRQSIVHSYKLTPSDGQSGKMTVTFSNPDSSPFDMLAIEYACLVQKSLNRLSHPIEKWDFHGLGKSAPVSIEGLPQKGCILDVSDASRPIALKGRHIGQTTVVNANPLGKQASRICIFLPGNDIPEPVYEDEISNLTLRDMAGVDMLIVTTDRTFGPALRLAQAHEEIQGLKVGVVRQQDIFNEFSSGAYHPSAIRAFTRMLHSERPDSPLRYLLMFGAGYWDSREVTGKNQAEYLVTYHTGNVDEARYNSRNYCSDQYFGMFTDSGFESLTSIASSVKSSIAIGRAPVVSTAEADRFVDKCISYLSDPTLAGDYMQSVLVAGIGDKGQHHESMEEIEGIIASHVPGATIHRGHLSLFKTDRGTSSRSRAQTEYLEGRLAGHPRLFNYSGHTASGYSISHENFSTSTESDLTYGSAPLVILAACGQAPLDMLHRPLGISMALNPAGPVAVIAAGREAYMNLNHVFNAKLISCYYSASPDDCIGDIFQRVFDENPPRAALQRTNDFCYNLLGDPALPAYIPSGDILVTTIDGKETATVSTLPCGRPISLSGTVTGPDGKIDRTFSGHMTLSVYDAPVTHRTYAHVSGDPVREVRLDEAELHSIHVNVTEGRWASTMTLPPSQHDGTNRMAFYAISDDRRTACGYLHGISITDDTLPGVQEDTDPPVIDLWINSPDTKENEPINGTPILHVSISDNGSGVMLNRATAGGVPVITLDGVSMSKAANTLRACDDGAFNADIPLVNLSDGRHAIRVTARDLAGNLAVKSLGFITSANDFATNLTVPAIVRDCAEFDITHNMSSMPDATLSILDITGSTLLTLQNVTFPFAWDFTLPDGTKAPDGTYRASATLNDGMRYVSTPYTEFTIVKF